MTDNSDEKVQVRVGAQSLIVSEEALAVLDLSRRLTLASSRGAGSLSLLPSPCKEVRSVSGLPLYLSFSLSCFLLVLLPLSPFPWLELPGFIRDRADKVQTS